MSASDLSDNVAKVCTLWRTYSSAYQLWKRLDYTVDGNYHMSQGLKLPNSKHIVDSNISNLAGVRGRREQVSVFHTASAFQKLTLKDSSSLKFLLPMLFSNCLSIQELVISGEDIDPDVLSNLAR